MSKIKELLEDFNEELMQKMTPEEIAEYMLDLDYENQAHRAYYNEYL
tara:strand:- start:1819 stop:1959 length:141 start_codon:yes stop_codon:yes gene_type:complete